jgi:PAS domain S-box-containing protein
VVSEGKAGRNVNVADIHSDERTADCSIDYNNLGVGAYIAVPLLGDGQWVSSLIVTSSAARSWSEREVTLVAAVAERTWLAVEKLRLDSALRQSEAQLRRLVAILEQTTDFVGTADTNARATYLNRAGRKIIGVSEDADVSGFMLADCHPPWAARIVTEVGIPHAIEHGVWRGETALRSSNGKEIRVSQLILSHRDPAGKVDYLSTVARDITEQKQLEQALRDADRRKDEFIATLAHELRNPLTLIGNVVELLQRPGASETETRRGHHLIERQADYLTRLTDDLFDISRITREKVDLYKERVELGEIINAASESSQPLIDDRGHDLSVELSGAPIYVDGDKVRLTQIFMNLLTNAAKYTPQAGHIWLKLETYNNTAVVSVRDNGAGIPAPNLPHLFDMFYQVDRSFSQVEGGLGLGLTLVRRLVEMHGGTVEAKSDGIDCGSEFTVRLPVFAQTQQSAMPQARSHAKEPMPQTGRRILIADDFPEAAATLAKLLQESGNQVQTAQDGIEAIETAAKFHPDIAVLDIAMPRLNGYDTARRIREQPWGKNMILVAFTGWGQSRDRRRSKEAGFDAHLTKPIRYEAFLELLANLSQERRTDR